VREIIEGDEATQFQFIRLLLQYLHDEELEFNEGPLRMPSGQLLKNMMVQPLKLKVLRVFSRERERSCILLSDLARPAGPV
jgi:hypothetical protein